MEKFFRLFRYIAAAMVAIVGLVLTITLIVGGVFFDVDAYHVAPWIFGTVLVIAALLFIIVMVAFIGWFLLPHPYMLGIVIAASVLVFLGTIFMWLIEQPAMDLGTYLQPLFAFMK